MLGSDLIRSLGGKFKITPINRENYQTFIGKKFDIIINANGNSKRFWANQNPVEDFSASTFSVIKSIFDFPANLYIYISSPDVYANHTETKYTKENEDIHPEKLNPYGFHKYLSELIVKKYKEKFIILRASMILGTNLKKGPFFDIINNNPLHITLDSRLQLITTKAISEIIETLIEKFEVNETINIGGKDSFSFTKTRDYFDKEIKVSDGAETQVYEMAIERLKSIYPNLKTSEEYLEEFLGP